MPGDDWKFDTKRIHAGYDPDGHAHSTAIPIYQTASFELGGVERAERLLRKEEPGFTYSRLANPTVAALEARVAALDGGAAAVAFASGMAALSSLLLCLGEGGGRIVAPHRLYGGSHDALRDFLPRLGVHCDFVEGDPASIGEAIGPATRAVLLETVSNPDALVPDFEAVARIAHGKGVPLVVDNTVATPALFRPLERGADYVMYSATKGLAGHGATIAGLVVDGGRFAFGADRFPHFHEPEHLLRERATGRPRSVLEAFPAFPVAARLRAFHLALLGAALGPFDAFLVVQGLETLSERISKQGATAARLAAFLAAHPMVEKVSHPAAPGYATPSEAARYLPGGTGGLFSFTIKGGAGAAAPFLDALEIFSYQPNIGDAKSLIVDPARVTHSGMPAERLAKLGIDAGCLRVSAGLEDPADLERDLERALLVASRAVSGGS